MVKVGREGKRGRRKCEEDPRLRQQKGVKRKMVEQVGREGDREERARRGSSMGALFLETERERCFCGLTRLASSPQANHFHFCSICPKRRRRKE